MAVIERGQIERGAVAAGRAAAGLGKRLSTRSASRLAEILLIIVLAALMARIALSLLAPPPRPPAAPAIVDVSRTALQEAANPFVLPENVAPGPSRAEETPEAAETTLDLQLHGTWVDPERGAAIIRTPDGKQQTFVIGDEICCGARLDSVHPDQVIITRAGARESLRLANKRELTRAAAQPAPAIAPQTAARAANAASIVEIVRFTPQPDPSGGVRFAMQPANDVNAFRALGLREGDVLLSVNGSPAPKGLGEIRNLLSQLRDAEQIEVTVERGGAPVVVQVALASRS